MRDKASERPAKDQRTQTAEQDARGSIIGRRRAQAAQFGLLWRLGQIERAFPFSKCYGSEPREPAELRASLTRGVSGSWPGTGAFLGITPRCVSDSGMLIFAEQPETQPRVAESTFSTHPDQTVALRR
jgi:hypothetical protein